MSGLPTYCDGASDFLEGAGLDFALEDVEREFVVRVVDVREGDFVDVVVSF